MVARILVINNDPLMRKVFSMSLEDNGWDILTYSYAEMNLTALGQLHPDLLILDFEENSEVAWGFLQMLKMEDTTATIPILITTTLNFLTAEIRAYLALQNIQIVYMPFVPSSFIKLIQRTLSLAGRTGFFFSHNRSLPILVVEDNEDLREGLAEILSLEGYQVVTADNGLVALNMIGQSDHSLIFLDIQMPIMDGFEFLKIYGEQLRQHRPVIVLSADASLRSEVFPAFVVGLLPKPYDIRNLLILTAKYSQAV
jgi:CheY-like chemotaxis protein